jgi:hypothetical protein
LPPLAFSSAEEGDDRPERDAAVERRRDADRSEEALASQLHAQGVDRTRLAAALDGETARSRRLEATNREIAQRLDTAIASIQSVLDGNE